MVAVAGAEEAIKDSDLHKMEAIVEPYDVLDDDKWADNNLDSY